MKGSKSTKEGMNMENDLSSNDVELDDATLAFQEDAMSEADALASVGDPALSPDEAMANVAGK
ncbi:hypothetical protein RCH14_004719 [Massilia sp. MP_M2]